MDDLTAISCLYCERRFRAQGGTSFLTANWKRQLPITKSKLIMMIVDGKSIWSRECDGLLP